MGLLFRPKPSWVGKEKMCWGISKTWVDCFQSTCLTNLIMDIKFVQDLTFPTRAKQLRFKDIYDKLVG